MPPEPSEKPADDFDAVHALLYGKVAVVGDCWEWQGYRMPHGHGQIRRGGMPRAMLTHRYVWRELVGDYGDLFVLHHCDNPPCVRPSHLWLGTQTDNNRDMREKGRDSKPPLRWDGIHCKRGHVISDNEYRDPKTGARRCKTCMNAKSRRWMREHKQQGKGK